MLIRPLLVAVSVAVVLAGCAAADSPAGPVPTDAALGSADPTPEFTPADPGAAAPPASAAVAPVGCDLVTADLVIQYLGVDPGACEPIESWADGPAGLYPAITLAIDTTASAPMYMPREVCGGGGIEGALPVPGADYGYAVEGELCVIVGSVGVKASALLDSGVAPASEWQALAVALLGRL